MPLQIARLPPNILFKILLKLTNKELCRIRRTCTKLDDFAENTRRTLSSRKVDYSYQRDYFDVKERPIFSVTFAVEENGKFKILHKDSQIFETNLRKRFSGIFFDEILLKNEKRALDEKTFQVLLDLLIEANTFCKKISITGFSANHVLQITSAIASYGPISIEIADQQYARSVAILKSAPYRDRFDVHDYRWSTTRLYNGSDVFAVDDFVAVKHFASFEQRCSTNVFYSLLQTMMTDNDVGNMKSLRISFDYNGPRKVDNSRLPPFELLWDRALLPDNIIQEKKGQMFWFFDSSSRLFDRAMAMFEFEYSYIMKPAMEEILQSENIAETMRDHYLAAKNYIRRKRFLGILSILLIFSPLALLFFAIIFS